MTPDHVRQFEDDGYAVAKGLFSKEEAAAYYKHFMDLRHSGSFPGDYTAAKTDANDPLQKYPRMIHMHRWDEISLKWLLDKRLGDAMTALLGTEPFAAQTMLYFKPPGARGQALHQDQFYLRAKPGTCIAAWMALEPIDEGNGCLQVVPGSHKLPLLCTKKANNEVSFSDVEVPLAEGMKPTPVIMDPGDVMFFHGQLIHGSYPNTSAERFRLSLIGHYIAGEAHQVATFYHPVLRFDGSVVEIEDSPGGGPCGVWVDQDVVVRDPLVEVAAPGHE
jgi:phytanoyl-CoA hydroxylase